MKRRGRPKSPGILTPRELEVVALLRDGLSNREIAERLGISLAGAKFHVSEIITKLGLSSREEAAMWRPRMPLIALPWLANWRRWPGKRLVLGAVASSAVVLTGALFVLAVGNNQSRAVEIAATSTPEFPRGMRMDYKDVGTLEEAQRLATFELVVPSVPADYRIKSVRYFKPDFRCPVEVDVNRCVGVHNDHVTIEFESTAGSRFVFTQGYGGPIGVASYHFAPDSTKGEVATAGRQVFWVRGHMRPGIAPVGGQPVTDSDWLLNDSLTLSWFESRDDNPTGSDSPRCLGLYSTSLSLEQLLPIAASVPRTVPIQQQDPYRSRC